MKKNIIEIMIKSNNELMIKNLLYKQSFLLSLNNIEKSNTLEKIMQ